MPTNTLSWQERARAKQAQILADVPPAFIHAELHWDKVILPQPPIRQALKDVEEKLKAAGHEVFAWTIDQARALDLAEKIRITRQKELLNKAD